jgi:hypothetical protein
VLVPLNVAGNPRDRSGSLPEGEPASGGYDPIDTGRAEVVDAPTRYAKHEGESCWTHDYLLRHSEQYRVDLPGRHLGYVEDIVFPPGESEPIGFLVRGDSGLVFVSARQIRDFSPRAQRILVDPLPVARHRSPARLPRETALRP